MVKYLNSKLEKSMIGSLCFVFKIKIVSTKRTQLAFPVGILCFAKKIWLVMRVELIDYVFIVSTKFKIKFGRVCV